MRQECGENAPEIGLVKLLVAGMVVRALLDGDECLSGDTQPALHKLAIEIRSNPGKEWALPRMAQLCHLSVPQFTRKFRGAFGTSPRQFVILQWIRRAIHLLRESQTTIQEIAASLGYTDHYFFHRQFKFIAGVTPTEARKGAPTAITE